MLENTLDIVPSIDETIMAFKEMTLERALMLLGVTACLILWAIPLTGIDRRDLMTKLTYIAFCMAFAAATILARPANIDERGWHFLVLTIIAGLAWLKWSLPGRRKATRR